MELIFSLGSLSKDPVQVRNPLWHSVTSLFFLRWGVVSPTPNPPAGGPPFVGCPRLLIQYIRNYPPYLEAVSAIHNLRRAMPWWQGSQLTWIFIPYLLIIWFSISEIFNLESTMTVLHYGNNSETCRSLIIISIFKIDLHLIIPVSPF
jgi:hypothetical protein